MSPLEQTLKNLLARMEFDARRYTREIAELKQATDKRSRFRRNSLLSRRETIDNYLVELRPAMEQLGIEWRRKDMNLKPVSKSRETKERPKLNGPHNGHSLEECDEPPFNPHMPHD